MVQSLWEQSKAQQAQNTLDELVYRSNLIGSDRRVCNWGGGNTSSKTTIQDFRGKDIEVMYVKARIGSGYHESGQFHRLADGGHPAIVRKGFDVG